MMPDRWHVLMVIALVLLSQILSPLPAAGTNSWTLPPALVMPPMISQPEAGTTVGAPIVIRGTGMAGHRVVVQTDFRLSLAVATIELASLKGSYGEATATVENGGGWEVQVRPWLHLPIASTHVTITATAVDSEGRRSISNWVIVWLR